MEKKILGDGIFQFLRRLFTWGEQLENDPMKIPAKLLVKQTVADLTS